MTTLLRMIIRKGSGLKDLATFRALDALRSVRGWRVRIDDEPKSERTN